MPPSDVAGRQRVRAAALAFVLAGTGMGLLSGCGAVSPPSSPSASVSASRPYTTATSRPGGDPAPGMGFDQKVGATCGVLSVIETNLFDAQAEHSGGSVDDASYAVIINTVTPDLLVIDGLAGYHLQDEIKNLTAAIKTSPATIAGADFDPESEVFTSAMGLMSQKCGANDSPIAIHSTTGTG